MRYLERMALAARLRTLANEIEGDGVERIALVFRDDGGTVHMIRDSQTDAEFGKTIGGLAVSMSNGPVELVRGRLGPGGEHEPTDKGGN